MQNKTLGILMIILLLFSACKDEETQVIAENKDDDE